VLDKMRANFTRAVIASPVTMLKQITAVPAYAMEIPVKDFIAGAAAALANPMAAVRALQGSQMWKDRYEFGWDRDVRTAMAKAAPHRMAGVKRHGPINRGAQTYMPIHDWRKARLREELIKSGIKLPIDYVMFGRSFDGLDLRFLVPLKKHRPADYKRVLEWFPLCEAEVYRYEHQARPAEPQAVPRSARARKGTPTAPRPANRA
jgi:hypothetical protein